LNLQDDWMMATNSILLTFNFLLLIGVSTAFRGCVFHENMFVMYIKVNNFVEFTLKTREGQGESISKIFNTEPWAFVSFGENKIQDSISILNIYPTTGYQLQPKIQKQIQGNET
jgi:hypothetical protein